MRHAMSSRNRTPQVGAPNPPFTLANFARQAARFYSTVMLSRNRRNSMKTNDGCTVYSTVNRGGAEREFSRNSPLTTYVVILLAVAAAFVPSPSLAKPRPSKSLTVERIYGSPSLSGRTTPGIEWTPDGKRISYLRRESDGVEMWTIDAATGDRKVLVKASVLEQVLAPEATHTIQATGLGRVEPDRYVWSPQGNALMFPDCARLIVLDLKTMTHESLAKSDVGEVTACDEDPQFSPNGEWIAFVREHDLHVVNVATGEERALTTDGSEEVMNGELDWLYPEEFDCQAAYWWSPDSSKIAYYQMNEKQVTNYPILDMSSPVGETVYTRYPQAGEANPKVRVGVVPASGGETKWMDIGANSQGVSTANSFLWDFYAPRVVWLADSRRVAIERVNRAQNQLDLLFADASTGASQTILTDTDKYWINVADDLYFFTDNKRFLWSSERSGFRHYYLYDLSGRQLDQLTSGDWTITGNGGFGPGGDSHPTVDEARGYIYFLSNRDELRGTDLYRVSLQDKSIARITRDNGVHNPIISPDRSAFVDTYSTAMTPGRQDLDRIDGSRVAAINENKVPELAEYHLSPVEWVDVSANDGTKLCASIIRPSDFDAKRKYPVLIDVYGGPQIQSVRDEWHGVNFLWDEMMAEKGYIIFSLDNRGSYFRGHAFETPVYHQLEKVELEDQLAGVNYLKSLSYVDASRIGIWGWSYGGTMTLEALFNAPDVFKAGAAVAPVGDWKLYDTAYTERYMGLPKDNPDGYRDSSPANQAAHLRGKLLIAHATGDDNVHFANTSEVINELISAGKYPASLLIFPGRGHGMEDAPARIQLFRGITEFLLNNL